MEIGRVTILIVILFAIVIPIILWGNNQKPSQEVSESSFSKEEQLRRFDSFNSILKSFVNRAGRVDYVSLRENPFKLDQYVEFISEVSPESRPDLFETEDDRKAYWINAYNALIMKAVVDNPGISSVKDLGWGMGIFWRKKFNVGGKLMTLNQIENAILRKKFKDPRIHFAINCASKSCPLLGKRIFRGESLDVELEKKVAEFIQNKENVRIVHSKREVEVSRIFKWYKKDFISGGKSLLEYILEFRPDISPNEKERIIKEYKIRFNDYDWGLNSQNRQ